MSAPRLSSSPTGDRRLPAGTEPAALYRTLVGDQCRRACELLSDADLHSSITQLFALLRSPISRRLFVRWIDQLKALASDERPVALHAVLASSTASRELEVPLRVLRLLRAENLDAHLTLHIFDWPGTEPDPRRRSSIEDQLSVREPDVTLNWVDSLPSGIRSLDPKAENDRRRDLRFCESFFREQRSFGDVSLEQGKRELEHREAIGRYLHALEAATPHPAHWALSTELHGRLAHCYRFTMPYLNLSLP